MYIKYESLERTLLERLDKLFGVKDCLIKVTPGKILVPPKFKELGERILNMEVRPDDIWLASYPRTGSTWCQEMVWAICNDLHSEAASQPSLARTPLIELTALLGNEQGDWKNLLGDSVELVEKMPSPRFIKTHLPWPLLPRQIEAVKPKIVYVMRNPKDMCVSYYHYCKLVHNLESTFEEFCELFLNDEAPLGPFWDHVLGFWEKRNEPNILLLAYEDMKRDHAGCIQKTASFLGRELSQEKLSELLSHLSFESMRKNPGLNLEGLLRLKRGPGFTQSGNESFIRGGRIGDWATCMTPQLSARFDLWSQRHTAGTTLAL